MLVNIKTAISKQEVCQNAYPPPIFVLFSPLCNHFSSIDILFSLKCFGFGPLSLFLRGNHTPLVGKSNADSQELVSDSKESNADSEESNANSKEFNTDSKESNADSKESGADSEESGVNSKESGANSKESGADSKESGADSLEFGAGFEGYTFYFFGGSGHE